MRGDDDDDDDDDYRRPHVRLCALHLMYTTLSTLVYMSIRDLCYACTRARTVFHS